MYLTKDLCVAVIVLTKRLQTTMGFEMWEKFNKITVSPHQHPGPGRKTLIGCGAWPLLLGRTGVRNVLHTTKGALEMTSALNIKNLLNPPLFLSFSPLFLRPLHHRFTFSIIIVLRLNHWIPVALRRTENGAGAGVPEENSYSALLWRDSDTDRSRSKPHRSLNGRG